MRNLTILLAEDSDDDAELIERALKSVNAETKLFRATDGAQAIQYLEGQEGFADRARFPFPDVLITDLKMPNISGLELLDWVHSHPECSLIPAILLSGSDLKRDVDAAYQKGANTFFHKPTTYPGLIELFRTLHDYWSRSELPDPSRGGS